MNNKNLIVNPLILKNKIVSHHHQNKNKNKKNLKNNQQKNNK